MQDELTGFLKKRIELESEEEIVLVCRKHWFVFRDPFLLAIFVPFLSIFVSYFLSYEGFDLPEFVSHQVAQFFFPYLATFCFIIGLGMFVWKWFLWRRTTYLVTNKRILIIRQNSLFSSDTHQMNFDKIQDVICQIKGVQASLYGFGDISIQASSPTATLVFETVGRPHEIQRKIISVSGQTDLKSG